MAKEINNAGNSETGISPDIIFWGASQLLFLALIARFKKNHDKYRSNFVPEVDKDKLQSTIHKIIYKQQSVLNILHNQDELDQLNISSAILVLQQQIYNFLNELHNDILELDIDSIYHLVPRLDQQRIFWNPLTHNIETSDNVTHIEIGTSQRDMIEMRNDIHKMYH
ncbi:MAG TPA: hypothetical protein VKA34_22230 [Balneolales bacterium]|nr:hypothetical protein [Balneolales bacterium]